MNFNLKKALASSAAVAVVAGGGVLAGSGVAMAAGAVTPQVGGLTITIQTGGTTGNTFSRFHVKAATPCPADGTNLGILAFGGNLPDAGALMQVQVGNLGSDTIATTGFDVPRNFDEVNGAYGVSQGTGLFRIQAQCFDELGTPVGTAHTGDLTFSTPTAFALAAAPAASSTTTLAASPAGGAQQGNAVTLTAHVTSTGTVAGGTVTFKDGVTTLGTGTVNAAGDATLTTSTLAVGARTLSATFAGVAGQSATSDSANVSYNVTAAPATPTTTTLAAPATAIAGSPVTLSATVAPAAAAGTVQFFDGTTSLGSAPVSGGTATKQVVFATAGSHSLTATFTATNPAAFQSSTSAAVAVTTTAPAYIPDVQDIKGTIPAGTIIITTPYHAADGTTLDLGTLALNPSATLFSGSAAFNNIKITDTRAGNLPWTASALASNLTSGPNAINGQNVGLTALVPTYTLGNALQNGSVAVFNNPAAAGVAAGDPGTAGLGGIPHKIASAAAGAGTVTLNGSLTLNAPTSTPAGTYAGTVTFTVVGS